MIKTIRTNASHQDFIKLVKLLDAELAVRDGEDHTFYDQFNKINQINYAVIAYEENIPVGCGAIKEYDKISMEVKRMYTVMNFRGKGIASVVLAELEKWAKELNYKRCILETGLKQPEAIKLYEKNGYLLIPNYGQYIGVSNSRCFEKTLK
ncbi:GNAT family N-acetyltransferase [Echinicola sp. CAU 1574]|uniref:GNAT family N-acetyltransferase n=1 Tax=Echinicola arenosa TaxID=2774144 RepID=A0ABR9AJP1_9BACT|nr:GNAT family N-acetyltransferase [Echinicola arenosa]MBD8489008.1 GNAT family N-acetyltransferase [Echinicola arenosa]